MKYIDEYILETRRAAQEIRDSTIVDLSEKIFVKNISYLFERKKLGDKEISLLLPINCEIIDKGLAAIKYPYQKRPEVILTVENQIDFTFNFVQNNGIDLALVRQEIIESMKKAYPANLIYETGEYETEQLKIFYFNFRSFTIQGSKYNMMFLFYVSNQIVIGNMNCDYDAYSDWDAIFLKMVESIQLD